MAATELQNGNVITGFHGTIEAKDLLQLASGFSVQLEDGGPEDYRDHQNMERKLLGQQRRNWVDQPKHQLSGFGSSC